MVVNNNNSNNNQRLKDLLLNVDLYFCCTKVIFVLLNKYSRPRQGTFLIGKISFKKNYSIRHSLHKREEDIKKKKIHETLKTVASELYMQ